MLSNSYLVKITRTEANSFLSKYEHLGNVGLGVWHWGLMLNQQLISVVSYGTTCFSQKRGWLSSIAQNTNSGIVQLCRGGTIPNAPKGTPSHLISMANKEIYKTMGSLLIVAYSDTKYCEIGTIYQACNSIYIGLTDPKGQANYIINGEKLSGWQVRKCYGTRSRCKLLAIDPKLQVIPLNKKHRYIMVVGPKLRKRYLQKLLVPYSLPYPKRKSLKVRSMIIEDYIISRNQVLNFKLA